MLSNFINPQFQCKPVGSFCKCWIPQFAFFEYFLPCSKLECYQHLLVASKVEVWLCRMNTFRGCWDIFDQCSERDMRQRLEFNSIIVEGSSWFSIASSVDLVHWPTSPESSIKTFWSHVLKQCLQCAFRSIHWSTSTKRSMNLLWSHVLKQYLWAVSKNFPYPKCFDCPDGGINCWES